MNKVAPTERGNVAPAPIFSINLIRELRGSPLTVLMAILLLEQAGQIPITAQLLKDITGYGDHTITDSLRVLESPTRQIIRHVINGWRLSRCFQLPLEFQPQNRDIRGFIASSSCSLNESTVIYSEEEQEENRDIRGFTDNHAAALKAGIRDPKATTLAKLPHVTPDFIRGHIAWVKKQGNSEGTAIYRIEHNWPVPDEYISKQANADHTAELTSHEPGCKCIDCQLVRAGAQLCPNCRHYYCECEEST
jgi:hypothetical protein